MGGTTSASFKFSKITICHLLERLLSQNRTEAKLCCHWLPIVDHKEYLLSIITPPLCQKDDRALNLLKNY